MSIGVMSGRRERLQGWSEDGFGYAETKEYIVDVAAFSFT